MSKLILLLTLTFLYLHGHSQEDKRIRARKIVSISSRVESVQKDKRIIEFVTTHYDKKGRELSVIRFNGDSICVEAEYFEYNRKGRTTMHTVVDSVKHQTTVTKQQYDRWNHLVEKQIHTNGLLQERITYSYNNLDDKTGEVHYDEKGELKKQTFYSYDSRGMLTKKQTLNAKGEVIYEKINQYDY